VEYTDEQIENARGLQVTVIVDWAKGRLGISGPFPCYAIIGQAVDVAFDGRYIVPPAMSFRNWELLNGVSIKTKWRMKCK